MGPLRRGLIVAALPGPAWAEVCDKERPDWDGLPTTPVDEAVLLFSTLPALALIAATLLAWRFRSTWGGLICVLAWSSLITLFISLDADGVRDAVLEEGCRGDPILFIAAVIAICVATVFYTAPHKPRAKDGE